MLNKPSVAIITSLTGGLGHYAAHLASPLSQYCEKVKFITYPQIDPLGTIVKEVTDPIIKKYVKYPRFDIDESSPASIININRYLDEKGISIINIHVATTVKKKINYFVTFIDYSKKICNRKIVLTLHDVLPFDEDSTLIPLLKVFYGQADHITVGNPEEKAKLIKHFQISERKISIIPHGIYNLFDRKFYTQESARKFLSLPANQQVILFFGFLRPYKGFDVLIRAVNELAKKRDDFVVYVSSGIKYAPEDLAQRYRDMIEECGIKDKFLLSLKYIDTSEIEAVFKASDIVALPYTHASQSGVAMMAMGFAKPVVISDIFYDRTWIGNKAGLVFKSKNFKDLAKKVSVLLDNPEKAKAMGETGNAFSSEHLGWEKVAKQFAKVYQLLSK